MRRPPSDRRARRAEPYHSDKPSPTMPRKIGPGKRAHRRRLHDANGGVTRLGKAQCPGAPAMRLRPKNRPRATRCRHGDGLVIGRAAPAFDGFEPRPVAATVGAVELRQPTDLATAFAPDFRPAAKAVRHNPPHWRRSSGPGQRRRSATRRPLCCKIALTSLPGRVTGLQANSRLRRDSESVQSVGFKQQISSWLSFDLAQSESSCPHDNPSPPEYSAAIVPRF